MASWSVQCIVVPIDFSDESLEAVDAALQIAESADQIHIVHVLPELSAADPGVIWQTIDDDSRRSHAGAALEDWLSDSQYAGLHKHIEFGDAGHGVADIAEKLKAELIVMPSHGRRGLARLLIGSVTERVLRLSHCPVLVLRK